jgi:hypothetical protein
MKKRDTKNYFTEKNGKINQKNNNFQTINPKKISKKFPKNFQKIWIFFPKQITKHMKLQKITKINSEKIS